ncbi:thiamine pyrophosphate-dependent enzyme [Megasphaera hominis]|jgi:2-oxoglutarate ferredoxin oxidoreductase subunit beta|uniref:2-oxoglutarate ferredoxin oxidoreductase subunit beta n=1 Tax=Megasphaera hominis TaxID=159836 RepID=A0ABR6VJF6_9FIRM|nr:thiamine pyrophosphate-dependent enzyme [Megasphaera hominis]MBC3537402.1 2-oxoglutarate ferredoxin oxidoreductase subunit beta [Megasphaera hominis]
MSEKQHVFDTFLRQDKLPHIWCPGCGNGIVINALIRAIEKTEIDPDNVVIVSGIGCSSRANGYMNFCALHTNHGRALPYATGVKMFNPKLKVIVVTGDGDCTSIGGNHFIHACRRNIDITTVVFNNNNYGMTGGQFSPTTPLGSKTKTSVYGSIDTPFDICSLAAAAGATYVARSTVYHVNMLINQIAEGINHQGFSVVEAVCDCPTLYGRLNKKGAAPDMLLGFKENAVMKAKADTMTEEELKGKIVIGNFAKRVDRKEYTAQYDSIIESAKGGH